MALFKGRPTLASAMEQIAALGGTPLASGSFETPFQIYARGAEQAPSGGQLWPSGTGTEPRRLYEIQFLKPTGFLRARWPGGGVSGFVEA